MNTYKDLAENFSVTKLEFLIGTITKQEENNCYTIIIPIETFKLDEEIVDTKLWFDRILLSEPLQSYTGKTVIFPVNPTEGYIDGSTYLRVAHNPVDVSVIKFVKVENEILTVELTMAFVFEFEGIGFKNEQLIKEVNLIVQ